MGLTRWNREEARTGCIPRGEGFEEIAWNGRICDGQGIKVFLE